jgi:toxin FitB
MRLVLDTNVLSELMKPRSSAEVSTWLEGQEPSALYTTAITQAEILSGIAILPVGQKRNAIEAAALAMFADDLTQTERPRRTGAKATSNRIWQVAEWSG